MIGCIHIDPYLMIPTFIFKGDNVELGYWQSLLLIITSNVKTDLPNRRSGTKNLDRNLAILEIITFNVKMIALSILIAHYDC